MMKKVFSVLMMVLSLLVGFQQAIIVMHFKLNQEVIEQEFCFNKNKPELQCHGTCYLKKQLREAENKESVLNSSYHKIDILPISVTEFDITPLVIDLPNNNAIYKESHPIAPYREIFVPPPIV